MNFIQSSRSDESKLINLDHVVAFYKDRAGSTSMIAFETSSGETIYWRYYGKRENRDLDYGQLIKELREGN